MLNAAGVTVGDTESAAIWYVSRIEMIEKLRTKPFDEIKEKKNPLEMIAGIIRK